MSILQVSNLRIWDGITGKVLVPNSSFELKPESCLAIVGESGSGKSLTCRAIMKLNKKTIRQSGDISCNGVRLNQLAEKEMRRRRGKQLYMILQNGMRAFDPTSVIGVHIRDTLMHHYGWNRSEIVEKMKQAMLSVRLQDPVEIMNKYPHQLSGGMLQRVMISLAIVLEPDIIIADEPTSALDSVSKYEVMEQFVRLREKIGCSMIFVSHDLSVVRRLADEVLVMRNGNIVERGDASILFSEAKHEYTRFLVSSQTELNDHFRRVMGGPDYVSRGSR
ncbi:nickel transport system ATP-binding protein [Paenibacillus catalpae]|uniref:Nickel transport system ATP-binding protein n=1 Tax=Paenibacillus catalpae TaxID=1045775 RepID=A0A1I1VIK5_9BACL|nr:ABC transporter ATP-binding protein [Paenibacillus catalpae]SFD80290.1 nickel transport system ATP-binding protein [Paenibacillus catalpae]